MRPHHSPREWPDRADQGARLLSQSNRQHFTSIDALRGFAALSVALFHLGGAGLPKLASPVTTRLTSWGWTGVEVFFVISGFVIPFVMLKADYQWRNGRTFLARRFIRIWPPSAILIALTVAQYALVNRMGHGDPGGWTSIAGPRILANLAYAVPFTGQSWLNGILWTLSVEFQYYLFLALAFPLLASSRGWLSAGVVAAGLAALLPLAGVAQFLHYALYFAMGGAVLLYREATIGRVRLLAVLAAMAAAAAAEVGLLPTGFALAAALAIAFLPIRNRIFVFLGTISYSLYLVHMLVASSAEYVILRLVAPASPLSRLAAQFACLAIVIAGAWLFYMAVERHFVALSQRFAGHATRKRAALETMIRSEGM